MRQKRVVENPIKYVERLPVTGEEKRLRRAYTESELKRLLEIIPQEFKLVYLTALLTGLRRAELSALKWSDLHLNSLEPFIQLRAKTTKSNRPDTLDVRADLAEWLRDARGEADDDDKVFPNVPSMIRHKTWLKQAGIAWLDNEGRQADFHSLRVTLCSMLNREGVPVQVAMSIMRHKDIKLTTKVYNDTRIYAQAKALDKLPTFSVDSPMKAISTRTCDTSPRVANRVAATPLNGQKQALTDSIDETQETAIECDIKGVKHGLALTGLDKETKPMVGFEPTTSA
jgi:integrase